MKIKSKITILVDEHGNQSSVLMSVKHFKKLMNDLEDLQDLVLVKKRMKMKSTSRPLEEVMKELLDNATKK
jgi:hypothetical protein